jgi:methylglyoxal synthase
VSTDLALRAIAYAEAPTLSVGMALIAKHRMDVDAAMRAAELQQLPVAAEGAAEERAIDKIAVAAEALHVVDKVA